MVFMISGMGWFSIYIYYFAYGLTQSCVDSICIYIYIHVCIYRWVSESPIFLNQNIRCDKYIPRERDTHTHTNRFCWILQSLLVKSIETTQPWAKGKSGSFAASFRRRSSYASAASTRRARWEIRGKSWENMGKSNKNVGLRRKSSRNWWCSIAICFFGSRFPSCNFLLRRVLMCTLCKGISIPTTVRD